jgi:hypothetical protein
MSRNDEPAKAGPDANPTANPQTSRGPTPWPHSRAEAEVREILHTLRGNHVRTLAQIKEFVLGESLARIGLHHDDPPRDRRR